MATINYGWTEDEMDQNSILENNIEVEEKKTELSSRSNIQIMRRLFHIFNGCSIGALYFISFSHSQMIHLLGALVSSLYIMEQIRVNYPEKAAKFLPMTKFIIRAEEQLKESAMVPYAMAVLLTIITFPKPIALVGIFTLAIADPLSAIIGIRFGKHQIVPNRSIEGSLAFLSVTFLSSLFVLSIYMGGATLTVFSISIILAIICAFFEMIPLKVDDNLTIPLFTSASLWIICLLFGISF